MDAMNVLRGEHALIRQYLDNLSLALQQLESGERPAREVFEKAVDFSKRFVDKHHHFKEEHIMFTWLAQRKKGEFDASIDTLRFQHERGRHLVSMITSALDGYEKGQEDKVLSLVENTAAYVALLRHHIHREDHVFYPMVKQELAEADNQDLLKAFDEENQKAASGFVEK